MPPKQRTRDPEARKREIIEAAADLILEEGISRLSHRRVADRAGVPLGSTTYYFTSLDELLEQAIDFLGIAIDEGLKEVEKQLAESSDPVRTLAQSFRTYLEDEQRIKRDTAFYVASTENPSLGAVAARWFNGLVEILSQYTDPSTARAVALIADGASIHAVVTREAMDEDELFGILARVWRSGDAVE